MDLPLPFLGGSKTYPLLGSESVRLTRSIPVSNSTSSHFRPNSSPSLRPQCMASTYRASNLSPCAALRNARACSGERGLISFFLGLGALMPSVALRGIRPSETASFRALCSVVWMYCTVLGLEPLSSFSRYNPRAWVALPGPLPDRVAYVWQPAVEILTQLQATRLEGQPLRTVAKRTRQFLRYLLAGPAVHGLALGSLGGVDRITRLPTPIWPLPRTTAFTVSVLLGHLLILLLHQLL